MGIRLIGSNTYIDKSAIRVASQHGSRHDTNSSSVLERDKWIITEWRDIANNQIYIGPRTSTFVEELRIPKSAMDAVRVSEWWLGIHLDIQEDAEGGVAPVEAWIDDTRTDRAHERYHISVSVVCGHNSVMI